jgi:type IV pilus assembly protein PilE
MPQRLRPPATAARRGFTILELMVAVAIVGILAAVAIPSYTDYLRRGQLPEAFTTLSQDRVQLEQYYQDNRNYGTTACADSSGTSAIATSPGKYFTIACALTNGGQGYTLTATGATGTLSTGHVYTVNEADAKTTTKYKNVDQTGKTCWLVKGSEC